MAGKHLNRKWFRIVEDATETVAYEQTGTPENKMNCVRASSSEEALAKYKAKVRAALAKCFSHPLID